jgi:hypothetical protein
MQKLAGIVFILGSALFIIAAFMPITIKVITAPDPQKRMELIVNEHTGWLVVNLLFGVGSILTVIAFALFAAHVQSMAVSSGVKLGAYFAAAAAGFGAVLWVIIVYNRAALPAQEVAANLGINSWMFPVYTLLTQLSLIVVGLVLLQSDFPAWQGWGMSGLAVLSLVAFLVFKDMPPFVHYVLLLIMGIALVR